MKGNEQVQGRKSMRSGTREQTIVQVKLSLADQKTLEGIKKHAGQGVFSTLDEDNGIPPRPYYTVKEVADRLLVSEQTILRDIHGKKLTALQIRGCYRIGKEALIRYEAQCTTIPEAGTA